MLLFGMQFLDAHPNLRESFRASIARCAVFSARFEKDEPSRADFGFGSLGDRKHTKAHRRWARSLVDDEQAQRFFDGFLRIELEEYKTTYSDPDKATVAATKSFERVLQEMQTDYEESLRQEG
jgi:hypothetical protein